jgi:glycosyltransferase involved in cell wall biosynthesis
MNKIRIGIPVHGFIGWGGGVDYLRTIIECLDNCPGIEIHLIFPFRFTLLRGIKLVRRYALQFFKYGLKGLSNKESSNAFKQSNFYEDLKDRYPIHIIDSRNKSLEKLSKRLDIDVLIPLISPLPCDFSVPWVGWVADFQHHYFPENFSVSERNQRDAIFAKMFANCKSVIVGANFVKEDVNKLYPHSSTLVFVVPTIANPKKEWLMDGVKVLSKYGIKKNYLIVCNQFWKHKNHKGLFEAFAIFALINSDVDLVCTGTLEDYRDSEYINSLKKILKSYQITDRVHVLGLIPKLDQISLLKSSIALIQPTLFEGGPGGGSVYDAISLGKTCLVSNIPVNLEINYDKVYFFDPHNPQALSSLMLSISKQYSPTAIDEQDLLQKGEIRKAFALKVLKEAIDHAIAASKSFKKKGL